MAITFTRSEVAAYYRERFPEVTQKGREWRGPCPVHGGERDSFCINGETGEAFCHSECNRGWGLVGLEAELSNCDYRTARKQVFELLGKDDPEPFSNRRQDQFQHAVLEAIYRYTDANGTERYQVLRYRLPNGEKDFRQRRPSALGTWVNSLDDTERLPYRLPSVIASEFVFVVEGEKDVETMRRFGLTATCNSEGALKFRESLVPWFEGKVVCVLPDNDDKGRQHAEQVAMRLHPVVRRLVVLCLPNLPEKGDVTDFFDAGGTVDQLRALYHEAKPWEPPQEELKPSDADEPDPYVATLVEEIAAAGDVEKFWDFSLQRGIDTPFDKLTTALGGGMLPGEVYAIGGDTGSGKTSLGLQFIIHALLRNHAVLFFSIEMSRRQVFQRMIAIEALVNLNTYADIRRKGGIADGDLKRLSAKTREFLNLPLYVSSKGGVNPAYLVTEVKRRKEKVPNLDLVVVDHLQLMKADERTGSEYEKFTAISRALKQAAIEINVPVLVMAQTTRAHSKEKRYELERADIRGSGAIEEDLAGCMLIYPDREDIENAVREAQNESANNYANAGSRLRNGPIKSWLKLDKSRYGCSGLYLPLSHRKQFTRFDLVTTEEDQ